MKEAIGRESSVTEDALLGGRVVFFQPADGYRAAIDPVLLAASLAAGNYQKVLDVGSGAGAVSLCLAARIPELGISGIEVQPALVELARRNAEVNGFGARLNFVVGDLSSPPAEFEPESFDHVLSNPPFMEPGRCRPPDNPSKKIANVEGTADLTLWLDFCAKMVRPGGSLTIIHQAARMKDLLMALDGRFGGGTVFPIWPKDTKSARRIIVRCFKGSNTPMRLSRGLVLHRSDGSYTPGAESVLRHGEGIEL